PPAERASELRKEIGILQQKIDRLYAAIENGLDAPLTIQRINDLRKQQATLQAEVDALGEDVRKTADTVEQLRRVWANIRLENMQPEQLRAFIREFVEKIIVYDDDDGGHRVRIVLDPAHVAPDKLPENLITAPLSELDTFLDTTGNGLPLPKTAYRTIRGFLFLHTSKV
ncbi:MAG: hypothetical protein MSS49_07095, partial [Subdoligranulum variabile]|nr:hypothetical protein [Subdoligranulum variabile]